MSKKNSQEITCPCCQKTRHHERATNLPETEAMMLQKQLLRWGKPGWAMAEAKQGALQWACQYGIKKRQAILANPDQQKYCAYPPYLAYFDMSIICEDCKESFIFSGKEQQFWYETLHFWVQSEQYCSHRFNRKPHAFSLDGEPNL